MSKEIITKKNVLGSNISKQIAYEDPKMFAEVLEILQATRERIYRAVNSEMVETYWQIGKKIVEEEQGGDARAKYGDHLIENLSRYLGDRLGKGFSEPNLFFMKQFYNSFKDDEILYTLCRELSWSHIRAIMAVDSPDARRYYLTTAAEENWSVRNLQRNIKSGYFRRIIANKHGVAEPISREFEAGAKISNLLKDPHVLEFLNLPEDLRGKESLLEGEIIENLQKFLLEIGVGFSFVGRQVRISLDEDDFFVDLVLYNIKLKCYVLIDLKTEKLSHSDIGQMDMYVRMFDNLKRGSEDNPTIGIIFCTDKNEKMVQYSYLSESKQLFASKYLTVLPSEAELEDYLAKRFVMDDLPQKQIRTSKDRSKRLRA